jgi:hypothetical protein
MIDEPQLSLHGAMWPLQRALEQKGKTEVTLRVGDAQRLLRAAESMLEPGCAERDGASYWAGLYHAREDEIVLLHDQAMEAEEQRDKATESLDMLVGLLGKLAATAIEADPVRRGQDPRP